MIILIKIHITNNTVINIRLSILQMTDNTTKFNDNDERYMMFKGNYQ